MSAEHQYSQSPWRCETIVDGVGYRIWIDNRGFESQDSTRSYDWRFIQRYMRMNCMRCGPRVWGESEYSRLQLALDARDLTYVPLLGWVFIPLNFEIVSGTPGTPRPTFGASRADSFVAVLRNGQQIVGCQRFAMPDAPDRGRESWRETCAQLQRQLGVVSLYTGEELRDLAMQGDEAVRLRYSECPSANVCLVPIQVATDCSPADMVSAYLVFRGRRIALSRVSPPADRAEDRTRATPPVREPGAATQHRP